MSICIYINSKWLTLHKLGPLGHVTQKLTLWLVVCITYCDLDSKEDVAKRIMWSQVLLKNQGLSLYLALISICRTRHNYTGIITEMKKIYVQKLCLHTKYLYKVHVGLISTSILKCCILTVFNESITQTKPRRKWVTRAKGPLNYVQLSTTSSSV